ncbi:carboxylating nicotinate-nucleotide diphosphorylase [bacterium]|nr:carboxylating nicotinate-nucleotide diphosphorylase [bacterium]
MLSPLLSRKNVADAVKTALKEDVGSGDITTQWIAKPGDRITGVIAAQAGGILAGIPVALEVFRQLSNKIRVAVLKKDGEKVYRQTPLLRIQGPATAILAGERTALNFLGMLSGIATQTSQFVKAVKGSRTKILDTRKTTPGLRHLVKYAVVAGGGSNHRMGLYDAVLIKDNHIALANGSIVEAIYRARKNMQVKVPIEVEAETLEQVRAAVTEQVDIVLLDNFKGPELRQAIKLVKGITRSEVSGGITLQTARVIAQLGVDRISVGAITHSAPWLPIHMELE